MNGETTEQSLADRLEARAPEPCDCGRCVIDDLRAAAARLRKLDRIESALPREPVNWSWIADDEVAARHLVRRLATAVEASHGD